MDHFELHRDTDGAIYTFERKGTHVFQRSDDPKMTIVWEGPWGWVARLPENGVVAGRPWEILPAHQRETAPPAGVWVSRKGTKSYVYHLVHR